MIDIIFILIVLCLTLIGFYKGFFYILINSISIFSGIYLAVKFNNYLLGILSQIFKAQDIILKPLSFLFIFLFSISTFSIIHKLLDKLIKRSKVLTLTNRVSGSITGLLIGFFSIYYFSILIQTNEKLFNTLLKDSVVYRIIKKIEEKPPL